MNVPFNSESRDPRLLGQDVPPDLFDDRLRRRALIQFRLGVFIVDVVAHAHKLALVVAACEENDGDADDFAVGDACEVGRVCFENELVDADGYGPNEQRVKLLIIFCATNT